MNTRAKQTKRKGKELWAIKEGDTNKTPLSQFLAQLDQWSIGEKTAASQFKATVAKSAKKVPFKK